MVKRRGLRFAVLLGAIMALAGTAMSPSDVIAQNLSTICAVVQLQISQTATLERQAFSATLTVNNSLSTPLTNLQVQINVANSSGVATTSAFFVTVSSLTGTNAVDGTGVVQANGSATANWLLIPSTGTGGTAPGGQVYAISAVITATSAGSPQTLNTFPVNITVLPQPLLNLQYVLPFEVFGQEPLTPSVATQPVPFPLGLRVTNVGYGAANNFQVTSAQPQIVDNAQGLLVNFNLTGTVVNGVSQPNSLLVTYGNLASQGGVGLAEWTMTASLSGYFSAFSSSFTHSAALGGTQTSLIQNTTTYTLIKDVLDDQTGHDNIPDFLIDYTVPRSSMNALLDSGIQPQADLLLDSDVSTPTAVANLPGATSGAISGTSPNLTFSFTGAASTGTWVYSYAPFAYGATATVLSAQRSDGKTLNAHNVWISKHFVKSTLSYLYWINIFDFSPSTATYTIQFNPSGVATPPAEIADLSVATATAPGALSLSWNSPGDSGNTGPIVGGNYYIEYTTAPGTPFASSAAQVTLATTTTPGATQAFLLTGLTGNATYYLAEWTQNTEGLISTMAASATTFVLPEPPTLWAPLSISSSSILASWRAGNNFASVAYKVWLSTASGAVGVSSALVENSTGTYSYAFNGLSPNTTYYASGIAFSSATRSASPVAAIGLAVSSAVAPSSAPFSGIAITSITANWLAGADPPGTQFLVQASTDPNFLIGISSSAWTALSSATLSGLRPNTTYYARVKARNWALAETAYAALGSTQTLTVTDILPPRTTLAISTPSYVTSTTTYATSASTLSLSAVDDLMTLGDGLGLGVATTYVAVDTPTFSVYAGSFAIAAEGNHAVSFYSLDVVGNAEVVHSSAVAVDLTPPVTTLSVQASSATNAQGIVISSAAPIALSAVDPVSNGVASGVAATYYVIDVNPFSQACESVALDTSAPNGTCANEAYNGSFTLSVGTHTVYYFSEDGVGNQENVNVASVTVTVPTDVLPPRTTLTIGVPYAYDEGETGVYVSSETPFTLTAVDDSLTVGDGSGVGVAHTYYAIDGTTFTYTEPFYVVAEGTHTVSYYSVDLIGNTEVVHSTDVSVDNTPPVVSLYMTGNFINITAYDPESNGVDVGLDQIYYQVDAATAPSVYVSSFTLAPGTHTVLYAADDFLGNGQDTFYAATVIIDTTPPTVTSDLPTSGYENSATPTLALSYADSGRGVNTATVMLTLDGANVTSAAVVTASSVTYTPPSGLSQGTHTLVLTLSNLSGITTSSTSTFVVDTVPPVTSLQVDGLTTSTTNLLLLSTDTVGFISTDAVSGVAQTYYTLDAGTQTVYVSTFSVSVGTHTLSYYSVDKASNVESNHSAFLTVRPYDVTPPTLTLAPPIGSTVTITTPTIAAVYVDTGTGVSTTTFKLSLDGVSVTTRTTITASSATYVPTAALSQGTHTVTAQVADYAGNVAYATSTFFLDSIPPVTTLLVDGLARSATGLTLISTDTIGFVAVDTGTGVAETLYSLDASTPIVYTSTFSISAGTHTLAYHSVDNAGNAEAPHSFALSVRLYDITPPRLTLTPPVGSTVTITTPTVTAVYVDTGSAVNTATLQLALDGVNVTTRAMITASSATYVPPAALAQGTHTVTAQIADADGNVAYATSTFFLDSIPPVTTLLVDGLARGATSLVLVTTDTIGFVAVDSGTGVAATYYSLNGGTQTVYVSTFSLAAGPYTLAYHSVDKAGNVEATHAVSLAVNAAVAAPPTLTLTPMNGALVDVATPTITAVYVDTSSPVVLASFTLTLDGVNVTSHTTVGASTATYVPTAALAQGSHTVVASVANAAGLRASATSTFDLDTIAPVTSLQIDGLTRSATSVVIVTTDTVGFIAVDTGSGVAETLYSVNSTTYALVYTAPFSLAIGTYTIDYHSVDRAGNFEAAHAATLTVKLADTQPPTISLTPVNGSSDTTTAKPTFAAFYADTGTGINKASFQLVVDGVNVTTRAVVTSSSATYVPTAALSQGTHTAVAQVADVAGTVVSTTSVFRVDTAPPASTLLVDGAARSAASLVVTTTDTIAFSAVDPGGPGVGEILYQLSPSTAAVAYTSPFLLAVGTHTLVYHGVDVLGVAETPHTVALTVSPASNAIALSLSLSLSGSGSNETLNVSGSVQDAHTPTWIVSVAIGSDPASGYTAISTGVGNVSEEQGVGEGTILAIWSMNSLPSGNYTIKLSATDAFGNSASTYDIFQIEPGHVSLDRPAIAPATAAFGLLAHYAFPNPSNHGSSVDFRLQPGEADSVDLHIYNTAGRKILTTTIYNSTLLDDHNGLGTQYTYDYVWGVGGVGSGVYTYVFVAHKSGQTDIVVTGRAAVIK